MSVLQSLSTGSTFEGIHRSLITFRWPGRPVIGEQRFVSFGNFLELFLCPLRVILQDIYWETGCGNTSISMWLLKTEREWTQYLILCHVSLSQYLIWMILEGESSKSPLHLFFRWLLEEAQHPRIVLPLPPHIAKLAILLAWQYRQQSFPWSAGYPRACPHPHNTLSFLYHPRRRDMFRLCCMRTKNSRLWTGRTSFPKFSQKFIWYQGGQRHRRV